MTEYSTVPNLDFLKLHNQALRERWMPRINVVTIGGVHILRRRGVGRNRMFGSFFYKGIVQGGWEIRRSSGGVGPKNMRRNIWTPPYVADDFDGPS